MKSIQVVMGCQNGWHHEPGSYKVCPNKAVTNFLCHHKHSVWNCPSLIWSCLSVFNYSEMASKQQQAFRMCVHPYPNYLTGGDTHVLCVACLGWSGLSPLCHQQIGRWCWSCVWLYSHVCTGSAGVGWERCLEEHQCWRPEEMRYCCPFWPPDFCLSGSPGSSCTEICSVSESGASQPVWQALWC